VGVHVGVDKWLTSFTYLVFLKNLKVEFKSFKKTVKIGCHTGPLGWAAIHQQGLAFSKSKFSFQVCHLIHQC
jgi:hypothetical protein